MIKMSWATSANGKIGYSGKLAWHLPSDLRHFKKLTDGHLVVMGRKTWDSLIVKPLPGRGNIVLSRTSKHVENVTFIDSVETILDLADNEDIWIIGGKQTYDLFMPYAAQLHVSVIPLHVKGDVTEPEILNDWVKSSCTSFPDFDYEIYERLN
jgi:dihydrofolate reductase